MAESDFSIALNQKNYIKAAQILNKEEDTDKITSYIQLLRETEFFKKDDKNEYITNYSPELSRLFVIAVIKNKLDLLSRFYATQQFDRNIKNLYVLITCEHLKNPDFDFASLYSNQNEEIRNFIDFLSQIKVPISLYLFYDVLNTFTSNQEKINSNFDNLEIITSSDMNQVKKFCKEMHKTTQLMFNQNPFEPESFLTKVNELLTQLVDGLNKTILEFEKHKFSVAIYKTIKSKCELIQTVYQEIKTNFIDQLSKATKVRISSVISKVKEEIAQYIVNDNQQLSDTKLLLLFQLYQNIDERKILSALLKQPSISKRLLIWASDPIKEIEKLSQPLYNIICLQTFKRDEQINKDDSLFNQLNHKISSAISEFSYYFLVKLFESINQCESDADAEKYLDAYDKYKELFLAKVQSFTVVSQQYLFSKVTSDQQLESYEFPCKEYLNQEAYIKLMFYKSDMLTGDADNKHCCACGHGYQYACPKCDAKYCELHASPDKICIFCGTPLVLKEKRKK